MDKVNKKMKKMDKMDKINKTNKMNKRGWIMIIEAVIAVLILFSFVFIAMAKQSQEAKALEARPEFYNIAQILANRAEENDKLRGYVIEGDIDKLNDSLQEDIVQINPRLEMDVDVVAITENCEYDLVEKEIYVADAIIATDTETFEPKKLCVFVWEK